MKKKKVLIFILCYKASFRLLEVFNKIPFNKNKDFNLNNIKILQKKFNCEIGFSDHSVDNSVAMLAVASGVRIIEKHIALDNQTKGLDIEFSIKGKEIRKFKEDMHKAWE